MILKKTMFNYKNILLEKRMGGVMRLTKFEVSISMLLISGISIIFLPNVVFSQETTSYTCPENFLLNNISLGSLWSSMRLFEFAENKWEVECIYTNLEDPDGVFYKFHLLWSTDPQTRLL